MNKDALLMACVALTHCCACHLTKPASHSLAAGVASDERAARLRVYDAKAQVLEKLELVMRSYEFSDAPIDQQAQKIAELLAPELQALRARRRYQVTPFGEDVTSARSERLADYFVSDWQREKLMPEIRALLEREQKVWLARQVVDRSAQAVLDKARSLVGIYSKSDEDAETVATAVLAGCLAELTGYKNACIAWARAKQIDEATELGKVRVQQLRDEELRPQVVRMVLESRIK